MASIPNFKLFINLVYKSAKSERVFNIKHGIVPVKLPIIMLIKNKVFFLNNILKRFILDKIGI